MYSVMIDVFEMMKEYSTVRPFDIYIYTFLEVYDMVIMLNLHNRESLSIELFYICVDMELQEFNNLSF
jgi:hypothetical protein